MPTNYFDENPLRPWSLAEIYADLGSKSDIARTLDVSPHRVHAWVVRRERIRCPEPVRRIAHVDIYSMQEWRDWYQRWQQKHRPDTKWMDDAKPHGVGESFFTYFEEGM